MTFKCLVCLLICHRILFSLSYEELSKDIFAFIKNEVSKDYPHLLADNVHVKILNQSKIKAFLSNMPKDINFEIEPKMTQTGLRQFL